MFARVLIVAVLAVGLWALFARDSGASGPEQSYRVRAGDTLWSIAASNLAGDPRKGVWELQQRNRLTGTTIRPGQRLVLP
ncbi:MAG: LysM peptidoglycan-binding domain-containing protein [Gaiellaceae bacterium]|jgi:LysM repeat protein